jgi:drug/metabolite transporter (DMT)-like permease
MMRILVTLLPLPSGLGDEREDISDTDGMEPAGTTTLPAQDDPTGTIGLSSPKPRALRRTGLLMAVVSAATFGSSGTFGSVLLRTGWSPGAVVLARIVVAALVLTPPALVRLRGRWEQLRRSAGRVIAYGLIGVVGCQLPFFYAIQSMQVGVAVLLEFMGAVLVVGWLWARYRQRPRPLTIAGMTTALAGLAMMAGLTVSGGISGVGLMWGLLNAVSVAVYFFLSDSPATPGDATGVRGPLPPVVLSWAGMCAGAVILTVLGLAHAMPLAASTRDVTFLSHRTSWVVPVIGVGVPATAAAYTTGIAAVRYLGPKLASFIGMSEVLFASVIAWAALGQIPSGVQFAGGAFILAGVALVRADEPRLS